MTKIKLSSWSKRVKKSLIDHDLSIKELANLIGYSTTYTNNVINGRFVGSSTIVNKINSVLFEQKKAD